MAFSFPSLSIDVLTAVLLDILLGEPKRLHPLVGFGTIATRIDALLFSKNFFTHSALAQRLIGGMAVVALVLPVVISVKLASVKFGFCFDVICLYFAIGSKSLFQHAIEVRQALLQNDLELARTRVGMIVSRNTSDLDAEAVCRATIESILENGSDAIFGAIFWFTLLGPTGAIMFRLSNTLDAMWGYKTPRYLHFGWAAARFDDVLCWLPARLTALSYALTGDTMLALRCWRFQAKTWYSPNAGPVMATGAGALAVQLGGSATYNGVLKERPVLGKGNAPTVHDITRALNLVRNSMILWSLVIVIGDVVSHAHTWW